MLRMSFAFGIALFIAGASSAAAEPLAVAQNLFAPFNQILREPGVPRGHPHR